MFELAREVAYLRQEQTIDRRWPQGMWFGDDRQLYYTSEIWQARRVLILERDEYQCQFCNSTLMLCVHHRTYERFGRETPRDLITVCDVCHSRLHGKDGT